MSAATLPREVSQISKGERFIAVGNKDRSGLAGRWLQHFILLALIYGGTRLPDIQKSITNALASGNIDDQPKTPLVSPTTSPTAVEPSAETEMEIKVKQAVADVYTKEEKGVYGMLVRMTLDPEFETGRSLEDLATPDQVKEIVENYIWMVDGEPMAGIIKDFDNQSVPAMERAVRAVLSPEDFKSGQYPDLNVAKGSIVYVQNVERFGAGFSFNRDYSPVAVIFGDYKNLPPEIIRENVARVRAHENLIHPVAGLLKEQSEPKGQEQNYSDTSHASFGVAEDVSRLAMGANAVPNLRVVEAILAMEKGGMSKDLATKTMLRIGFGVTGDIPKAVAFYDRGTGNKGPSFYELLTGKQPPGRLVSREEIDDCRGVWARIAGVIFVPVKKYEEIYGYRELIPAVKGWGSGGCIVVNNACLDFVTKGGVIDKINNPGRRSDADVVAFVRLAADWSKRNGYETVSYNNFARDFWKYWNNLGRPKVITQKQWGAFEETFRK